MIVHRAQMRDKLFSVLSKLHHQGFTAPALAPENESES